MSLQGVTDVGGAATFRTSADAYNRHIGRYGSELAVALIAASRLRLGQRALDVGCGPGALTAAPILRRFWDAATALDPTAASLDEGRCMPYCRPDELRRLWGDTGLHEVKTSAITVEAGYSGFDDLWRPLESGVAPSGAYAAALPSERRARLREEFRRRLNVGNGPFRLAARAWCVVGRVPCSLSEPPRRDAQNPGEPSRGSGDL
jgi:hypothetical protein